MRNHNIGLAAAFLFGCVGMVLGAGYEFEGIGARQVARGGAAVSDVNDWTAIYWNPAGLARTPESKKHSHGQFGFEGFGGVAKSDDGNSLSGLIGPAFSKTYLQSSFILGSLGLVRPVASNWVIGTGLYTPLLQGADFNDSNSLLALDYKANAGIIVANFSLARTMSEKLLVGAGLNAVNARLKSDIKLDNFTLGTRTTSKMSGSGWGPEAMLGAQYKISPTIRLGAVYRTGSRISIKGDADAGLTGPLTMTETSRFSYKFNHPATVALGLSYEKQSKGSISFDINHTNWRSFRGDIDFKKNGLALLTDRQNTYAWRNTFKFRLGGIYRYTEKTDLLGGVSYDNFALDNGSVDFSTTVDVPIFRFSGGISHSINDSVGISTGLLMAKGRRNDEGRHVAYTLGGWQGMLEMVWHI